LDEPHQFQLPISSKQPYCVDRFRAVSHVDWLTLSKIMLIILYLLLHKRNAKWKLFLKSQSFFGFVITVVSEDKRKVVVNRYMKKLVTVKISTCQQSTHYE